MVSPARSSGVVAPIFLLVPQVKLPKRLDLAREAEQMTARVRAASATCRELKGWLDRVDFEEDRVRSGLAQFREELAPLLYALELGPVGAPGSNVEVFSQRTFAAE